MKYLGHTSWPSLQKYHSLMATTNKTKLFNIAKYIKEAMDIRKNNLEQ